MLSHYMTMALTMMKRVEYKLQTCVEPGSPPQPSGPVAPPWLSPLSVLSPTCMGRFLLGGKRTACGYSQECVFCQHLQRTPQYKLALMGPNWAMGLPLKEKNLSLAKNWAWVTSFYQSWDGELAPGPLGLGVEEGESAQGRNGCCTGKMTSIQ